MTKKNLTFLVAALMVAIMSIPAQANDDFTFTLGGGSLTKTRLSTEDGIKAGLEGTTPIGVAGLSYRINQKFTVGAEGFLTDRRDLVAFTNDSVDTYGAGQRVPMKSFGARLGVRYALNPSLGVSLSGMTFEDQSYRAGRDARLDYYGTGLTAYRHTGGQLGLDYTRKLGGKFSVSGTGNVSLFHMNAHYRREGWWIWNNGGMSKTPDDLIDESRTGASYGYGLGGMLRYSVNPKFTIGAGYRYSSLRTDNDVVYYNVEATRQLMGNKTRNHVNKGFVLEFGHRF